MSIPPPTARLVYKTVSSHDVHMQVWLPTSSNDSEPAPVVAWIHGGAFIDGSSSDVTPLNVLPVLARGWAFAALDYRLAPQVNVSDQLADIVDACKYISSGSLDSALGGSKVDGSRLALFGSSAGGFLALYAAYTAVHPKVVFDLYGVPTLDVPDAPMQLPYVIQHEEVSSHLDPKGQVVSSAPAQLDPSTMVASGRTRACFYMMQEGKMISAAMGDGQLDKKEYVVPAKIEKGKTPPTVIVHGSADFMVPLGASQMLHGELKKGGIETELIEVEGENHIFDAGPTAYEDPKKRDAFEKAFDFVAKYL